MTLKDFGKDILSFLRWDDEDVKDGKINNYENENSNLSSISNFMINNLNNSSAIISEHNITNNKINPNVGDEEKGHHNNNVNNNTNNIPSNINNNYPPFSLNNNGQFCDNNMNNINNNNNFNPSSFGSFNEKLDNNEKNNPKNNINNNNYINLNNYYYNAGGNFNNLIIDNNIPKNVNINQNQSYDFYSNTYNMYNFNYNNFNNNRTFNNNILNNTFIDYNIPLNSNFQKNIFNSKSFNNNNNKKQFKKKKNYYNHNQTNNLDNKKNNNNPNHQNNASNLSGFNNNSKFGNNNNNGNNKNGDHINLNNNVNSNTNGNVNNNMNNNNNTNNNNYYNNNKINNEKTIAMIKDQNKNKFIQKKIEENNKNYLFLLYHQIKHNIYDIINNQYGNYVIQKYIDYCDKKILSALIKQIFRHGEKSIYEISINDYGTRAIQKLFKKIATSVKEEDIDRIKISIKGNVTAMMKNINGSRVIQTIVEIKNKDIISLMYKEINQNLVDILITKPGSSCFYSIFSSFSSDEQNNLNENILKNIDKLINDDYGNFLIQKILKINNKNYHYKIYNYVKDKIVHLSSQKFSSNVIEKCLTDCPTIKNKLIKKIIENNQIKDLITDNFGNYIVQKSLTIFKEREDIFTAIIKDIKKNIDILKNGNEVHQKVYEKLMKKYGQYFDNNAKTKNNK